MRGKILLTGAVSLLAIGSCGGGTNTTSSTSLATAVLSPANGAVGQAPNVAVTATFSGDVTPSAADSLTLRKDGVGDSLCTSHTYDATSLIATCIHADLDPGASYTVSLTGTTGVEDATATFQTVINVSSMAKTTVASTSGGSVTLSFELAAAPSVAPTLAVEGATAGDCTLSGTTLSCPVSGVAGCTTFTDYAVTLSGDAIETYTASFNSADDEFDNTDSLANCWDVTVPDPDTQSVSIEDDNLNLSAGPDATGANVPALFKNISEGTDAAYVTSLTSIVRPGSGSEGEAAFVVIGVTITNPEGGIFGFADGSGGGGGFWGLVMMGGDGTVAMPIGSLADTAAGDAPMYFCLVSKSGVIRTYISTDGDDYTPLDDTTMACQQNCADVSDLTEFSLYGDLVSKLGYAGFNALASGITTDFDYIRFKTSGLTGTSSADCPAM